MTNANLPVDARIIQDFYGISPTVRNLWEDRAPDYPPGFFRFGPDLVCYGKSSSGTSHEFGSGNGYDALNAIRVTDSGTYLPFEFSSVIENLRRERYAKHLSGGGIEIGRHPLAWRAYYSIRELLPAGIRRPLQKAYFKGWQELPFPSWPVDFTVDSLHEELLRLMMRAQGLARTPFIWFWPDGAAACAILTHDVETSAGRDFSSKLIDMDVAHGFRASFEVIPERRYAVSDSYWKEIRSRGF